jgi:hypothetical protein
MENNFFADFGKVISEAEKTNFYGTLEFKFRDGRVILVTKTETILPADRGTTESNRINGASKNPH